MKESQGCIEWVFTRNSDIDGRIVKYGRIRCKDIACLKSSIEIDSDRFVFHRSKERLDRSLLYDQSLIDDRHITAE